MTGTISLSRKLTNFIAVEFERSQLLKSLNAALLMFLLEALFVISFGALIFSGNLADFLPMAASLILVGDAALVITVATLSSYPGSIAVAQDAPAVIIGIAVAAIASALPAEASQATRYSTVLITIVISTLLTGLIFLLLGIFKLGGLVRFLPYPVMGGFLAGTGWLLTTGGIGVMADTSQGFGLAQPGTLIRWLPGLLLGLLLLVLTKRYRSPLVLPAIMLMGAVVFFGVMTLAGISLEELMASGLLLGEFPSGNNWQFALSPAVLGQVDWQVLIKYLPAVLPAIIVSVVSLLLNANGLELVTKRDIHLDRELISTGVGNLAAGLAGGFMGYTAISLSTLNHNTSRGRRLPGLLVGALLGLTVIFGLSFLSYIPRIIMGGLLTYIGLDLLNEWVIQAWSKFLKADFLIIISILITIAFRGFLWGIALGLVLTIILFVVSYSRVNVIKHAMSGAAYQSRVRRSPHVRHHLDEQSDQIWILRLQGFIFFGTANSLLERVKDRTLDAQKMALRYVVLDFDQVPGMDSTAMLSFSKMLQLAEEKQISLVLTGLHGRTQNQLARSEFNEHSSVVHFFLDLDHGIEWCEDQIIATTHLDEKQEHKLVDYLIDIFPDEERLSRLISRFNHQDVNRGEQIIQQGETADTIFFIESGQVTVLLDIPGQAQMRLESILGGRVVGELGFYLNIPRTASVVADKPSVVYSLTRQQLEDLERDDPDSARLFHQVIAYLLCERVVHITRLADALQR